MMDRSRLIQQQQQLHDDRRNASPSSVPPPMPMMYSRIEAVNTNNNFNHHGGGASSLPIQWPNGPNNSCNPTTINYSNNGHNQHASAQHRMNDHDGHYSSHPTPTMMTYCPQQPTTTTTVSSSCHQMQNTTVQQQQQQPTQDLQFLYTLYSILSRSNNNNNSSVGDASIKWLPHGQGFIILNKRKFESTILKRILPNVKYASFVKRLKRYKFVRISSGSELGAYYHPYFRRDQPHLLPSINTMDEIPIERYGVNVTNVVNFGAGGGGSGGGGGYCAGSSNVGGGGNNGGGSSTFIVEQPPVSSSILKQDDFVPRAAAATATSFNPILKTTGNTEADDDSIHSASLSLGSISPISVSRGVSLTVQDDLSVDPSFFEGLGLELPFKGGDNTDDDDVTLESLEDDALLDHLESKICGGRGGAVAPCAATMKEASLLHHESTCGGGGVVPCAAKSADGKEEVATKKKKDEASLLDKAVLLNKDIAEAQQLLQERVLQFERSNLQEQVQLPPKQVITAPTPTVSPFYDVTSPHSSFSSNTTGNIGSCVEEDMKSFPDMLRQISKAKRRESSMSSQSCVEEDMKSFPDMLRQISKAKRRESSVSSQQKWNRMPSTSPVTSSFTTTTSTTLTTATSPVTPSFSTSRCSTLTTTTTFLNVPTGTSIGGGGHNVKRSFLSSRRGSAPEYLDTIRENTRKHQFRRRYSVSPQNTCYTMDEKSGKYRYPRRRNSPRTSPTFEKQLGLQQHPEEAQPNFGSLDWSQHSMPDESLLNLVTSYYKPHAGHPHRNQPQQEQPSIMLPPSPPPSTQAHQNSHNNHQQQLSETILHNVQQAKNLLRNRQQQNYGECGIKRSSEELELSDDNAHGNSCENFDRASPLRPEQQFPSYKRRCTL